VTVVTDRDDGSSIATNSEVKGIKQKTDASLHDFVDDGCAHTKVTSPEVPQSLSNLEFRKRTLAA
jgi:hypothetical protein